MSSLACPPELGSAWTSKMVRSFLSAFSASSASVLKSPNMACWPFRKRLFSRAASHLKLGTKRRNTLHKPKHDCSSNNDVVALSSRIASFVCDAISILRGRMTCPK